MKKALIAMSGGVDSSVAAYLIKKDGYDAVGITLRLHDYAEEEITAGQTCCSERDIEDARKVCESLSIPFSVLNFKDDFKTNVVQRFVDGYLAGETPNPCIDCNRFIKFERLFKSADEMDMDYVVTGHYARIEKDNVSGRYLLKKGMYDLKDQSYVLYNLTQSQLSRTLFPIGTLTKEQVRQIAQENSFINSDKPDSQDICFIKDNDYVSFIENWCGKKFESGDFVDTSGKIIAKHKGIIAYTIGQRKGLGIASTEPYYVIDKDIVNNRVIIGREKEQYRKTLTATNLNFIAVDKLDEDMRCYAKIRYKHKEAPARIIPLEEGKVLVEFDEAQRAVTKGQSVVFYDGDCVIGGGVID